VVLTSGIKS
jgi:hypothetical protein